MADKRVTTRSQDPNTQAVVELLTSILGEVQQQVQSRTRPPLGADAQAAVDFFLEIGAALALAPAPTITLTAEPGQFGVNGGTTRLTWASTDARTVSIDPAVGNVPVDGFLDVAVVATTTFTARATGPCGSTTASVTVSVQIVE